MNPYLVRTKVYVGGEPVLTVWLHTWARDPQQALAKVSREADRLYQEGSLMLEVDPHGVESAGKGPLTFWEPSENG